MRVISWSFTRSQFARRVWSAAVSIGTPQHSMRAAAAM